MADIVTDQNVPAPDSQAPAATQQQPAPDPIVEPKIEAPTLEPDPAVAPEPHPLEPGGIRFKQVVARSHRERERADALEQELSTLKAEVEALRVQSLPKTPTWVELEAAIAEGRITRAQANEIRDREVLKQAERSLEDKIAANTRRDMLMQERARYVTAVPELNDRMSDIRVRVDSEFDYLVAVQGRDTRTMSPSDRLALELTALRSVLGPSEAVRYRGTVRQQVPVTHQEITGQGAKPEPKVNPDQALLDKLTPDEVRHYRKMIDAKVYSDWKEVVEELKWKKPTGLPARKV